MFKFSRIITRQLASCKWITGVVFLSAYIFFSHVPTANAAAAPSDYSRLRDAMNTDPANGIAATKDYLAKNPQLALSTRATMERLMALTYLAKLNDPKSGLAVLDAGMAEVTKAPPSADQNTALATLLIAEARIFTNDRQDQQAVDLMDKNMPAMLKSRSDVLHEGLVIYGKALDQLKQSKKMIPVIEQALVVNPAFMEDSWMMGQLVNNLAAQGQGDVALGYARLGWMVCPFDTKSISAATNIITATWLAADLNAGKGNAFIAAQNDSKLENPLTAVKLPTLDGAALDAAMGNLPASDTDGRITILLAQGKMRDAMLAARRGLLEHPSSDNSGAILEMARVFKAADLNLVRANAFLQYFQSGKGANPLDDFFKQFPAEVTAK
jgi:hypothetical protein